MSSHTPNPQLKTALVTGGAQRIGRSLCIALAQAGYAVAVHYHRSHTQAQELTTQLHTLGVNACALAADLSDPHSTHTLMQQAQAQLGPIGVLINNASVFEYDSLTQTAPLDLSQFEQHWRTNTYAPMLLAQQLHHQLPDNARGVIINLLDQKLYNPNPDYLSYTLSKAALKEATILAAQALAPRIRVLGIAPGLSLPSGHQSPQDFERIHANTLLKQGSTPEDIAAAMLFALNATAMTGTILQVDGGQHLTPSPRDVIFMHN